MESQEQRCVRPSDWLAVMHREYLCDFIRPGGAAVKVLVPSSDGDREVLSAGLRAIAEQERFVFAAVDAATTKVHLVDKLFHALATQIPWRDLAESFVAQLLEQIGCRLPERGASLGLEQIAELNGRDTMRLGQEFNRLLERRLVRDYAMCQEFRFAMVGLCLEVVGQGSVPPGVMEEWLRGELRLISAMKPCLIFQKITRHNARHMLLSLAHWLRLASRSGLVLMVDISRYTVERRPRDPDGTLYYSRAAMFDAYEVIRQFIDGTDDAEGCFTAVLATSGFLSDDRRGLNAYDALQFRVQDEVHDRYRPNPLATLVRISGAAESLTG